MPKNKRDQVNQKDIELPSTLERSDAHAQEIFRETMASAEEQYGSGERAGRTAYASLKHSYEKVGDHWEPKKHQGPSDPRAEQGWRDARSHPAPDYGGVDVEGHTKPELADRAKKLGVSGISGMTKSELAEAINAANQRATAKARRQND